MIYVMMTFSVLFVKPSWCQSFEEQIPSKLPADAKEYPECTRFIGEEGKVVEYHRSNVPLFNSFTVSVFCWVSLNNFR